ncbi:fructose-bisphosphate aldolase [Nitzschia inconspicua]|uniref:Fructose-bisphosphate aldolase n=1 Tax=Nitzschia inconspicua TaxID=303405 RepID=A0A9K3PI64_9STRA|nr:fructose-bisphosphate aldolase [Nitzschia inconspicua]
MRNFGSGVVAFSWLLSTLSTCEGATETGNTDKACAASNDWDEMHRRILRDTSQSGVFLAALDQSGGSTPKALELYGISPNEYESEPEKMYELVHDMRTRIINAPSFTGDSILGAILFEDTMDRTIDDIPTATFLWQQKGIVPFLKIDKGLAEQENGVQLLKPMPDLDDLLEKAKRNGIYGTKMRSLIHSANKDGIATVVEQQFEIGKRILGHGLIPIIEPEVDIAALDKPICEDILRDELLRHLNALDKDQKVMLKLTLPTNVNQYKACVEHPNCLCVLALSGGYSQIEANDLLLRQNGMIASFSRALTEGLSAHQTDDEFNDKLKESIRSIVAASTT